MTVHSSSGASAQTAPELIEVEVGPMAHGGHCVARHEGRVVFVRHAIPGEIVRVLITDAGEKARFWRGDVVEVLRPSEFRRTHQWKLADSLRAHAAGRHPVGGAEYGHIVLPHQRRLKAQVFRDTLQRIADLTFEVHVSGADGDDPTGLHWRTRNAFAVTPAGRLSMHVHRSSILVPVRNMPLGVHRLDELKLWDLNFTGIERVEVATPAGSDEALVVLTPTEQAVQDIPVLSGRMHQQTSRLPEGTSVVLLVPGPRRQDSPEIVRLRGRTWVQETVESTHAGRKDFRITADGFWQVHRRAPALLVDHVLAAAQPSAGQTVADLYGGAGLFSAFLAEAVGPDGTVLSVEASPGASRDARRNLHAAPPAVVQNGTTDRVLAGWLRDRNASLDEGGLGGRRLDTVVLDPPRAGAGQRVVEQIHQLSPGRVVYVSCDPASFARDLGQFTQLGWRTTGLEVLDLYPDTHHMESVAVLERVEQ